MRKQMKETLDALDTLFSWPDALAHGPEVDALFLAAMQEVLAHHYADSPVYRGVCDEVGFAVGDLRSPDNLPQVPWILVDVFKWYHLASVPEEAIVFTVTSSGTGGQKSHVSCDRASLDRQTAMRRKIMESYGLVDTQPVNYLCFSYDEQTGGQRGAAYTHTAYTTFAPAHEIQYAIHPGPDGQPTFDAEECAAILRRYARQPYPLRITGFPAFAWHTLQALEADGRPLRFDPSSLVIHGGGWKTMAGEAVAPEVYAGMIERWLGIPAARVRDVYGFVEHGVPYISCEARRFHVPIYARAYARQPGTLDLLPQGEVGLLHVLSPYNWAQPALSILSTDYARVEDNCPCGRPGETLGSLARAGVRKHQGCALTASELLARV
jgi:phenylacetate-coenzyme A ligase PaaK-like adenylate-forming protein